MFKSFGILRRDTSGQPGHNLVTYKISCNNAEGKGPVSTMPFARSFTLWIMGFTLPLQSY